MPATVLYGAPLKRDKSLEAPANSTPTVPLARMPYTSCLPAYGTPLHHEKKLQKGLATLSLITSTVGVCACRVRLTPQLYKTLSLYKILPNFSVITPSVALVRMFCIVLSYASQHLCEIVARDEVVGLQKNLS